jgi:hypothetical protein
MEGIDGGEGEIGAVVFGECFLQEHGPEFGVIGEEHGLFSLFDEGDEPVDIFGLGEVVAVEGDCVGVIF